MSDDIIKRTCKNCGADIPDDAALCPFCMEEQVEKLRVEPPNRKRKRPWLVALPLLCILVIGVVTVWQFVNDGDGLSSGIPIGEKDAELTEIQNEDILPSADITLPVSDLPEDVSQSNETVSTENKDVSSISDMEEPVNIIVDPVTPQSSEAEAAQSDSEATNEPANTGHVYEGEAQVVYTDEDGEYNIFLMLHNKRPAEPQALYTVKLSADEGYSNPSQLFIVPREGTSTQTDFMDKVTSVQVETVPLDGGEAMKYQKPAYDRNFSDAVLVSHVSYTAACGTNEIIWVLNMKNGDTICVTHRIATMLLETLEYNTTNTSMNTTAELQALLSRIESETTSDTVVNLYLPPVTYDGGLDFSRRKINLYGSSDGTKKTTFTGTVTINHTWTVDINNVDFVGNAGIGLSATAGIVLKNCRFSGWDTGVAANNGAWVVAQSCVFEDNQVGFEFNSSRAYYSNPSFFNNQFLNNDTALLLTKVPGQSTLTFANSSFAGNEVDIQNNCNYAIDTSQATFD